MDKITVLGMDPAMSNWGYAKGTLDLTTMKVEIDRVWTVVTEKASAKKKVRVSSDDIERARTLSEALEEACQDVQIAFAEIPHGSQSASGAKSRNMCIGILGQCRVPLVQLQEQDVKLRTTGKKTATKADAIKWAFERHPDTTWKLRKGYPLANQEHNADAIATIYAGIKDDQFQAALSILRYMNKMRA